MHPRAVRAPLMLAPLLTFTVLLGCGGESDDCDLFASVACLDGAAMLADVERLASAEFQGRRAGTAENDAVVDLVASRFAVAGLGRVAGSHRQPFQFEDWVPGTQPSVSLGGSPLELGTDYEPLWFSGSGSTADVEVVFAGYGLTVPGYDPAEFPDCPVDPAGYDAFADVDLTGKVALVFRGLPADDHTLLACPSDPLCDAQEISCYGRQYQSLKVEQAGAVAMIQALPYWQDEGIAPFAYAPRETTVPAVLVARHALEAAFPDLPAWAERLDDLRQTASRATGVTASLSVDGARRILEAENVLGVVPGADPALRDEVVVVGAHLDHMGPVPWRDVFYPGADDNASGTAVLLELVRAVSESPTRPARTLLFAAWNAEELGLIGSCVHVLYDPAFPLDDTVAAFSVDMVGAGTPGLELWGATEHPEIASAAEDAAESLGLELPLLPKEPLMASDHYCYAWAGVPGLLASTPEILDHPYYHSPQDTADTISLENLHAAAAMVWASVRPLAEGSVGRTGGDALRALELPPPERWLDAWAAER